MPSITAINTSDVISATRSIINTNFTALNNAVSQKTFLTLSNTVGADYNSTQFQTAINALNLGGGGMLIVRGGNYSTTNITPRSNVHIFFENGAVINNSAPAATAIFRHTDDAGGLTNFVLENGKFTGGNIWYSRGNVIYCRFINNKFYGVSSTNTFLAFFDAYASNPYNTIKNNIFSGSTGAGGWDMLGSGALHYSEISCNQFENNSTGQGFACNTLNYARIMGNIFSQVGNGIGLEGACESNIIQGNTLYRSGNLKLAQVGVSTDISRRNKVSGNMLAYSGGIEDGQGYGDTITDNTVFRSSQKGIFGSFDRCQISVNEIYETNSGNAAVTVNSVSQTDGGIVLLNSASIATPTGNQIKGNKLYTSRASWTHPDGTTKQGWTGGILIDSSYSKSFIDSNSTDNTYAAIVDAGSMTTLGTNQSI